MGGMKKGGKRFLVIPPNQAYGSQGVANRVPADSTLIFEAEVKRVRGGNSLKMLIRDEGNPSLAQHSIAQMVCSLPVAHQRCAVFTIQSDRTSQSVVVCCLILFTKAGIMRI